MTAWTGGSVGRAPPRVQGSAVPSTSFVGRSAERDEVAARLGPGLLVTLIGSGGAGKTRLAVEVASSSTEDWPGGAWFVDLTALSPGSGPGDVVDCVCRALRIPGRRSSSPLESLLEHLAPREALLVLDNCEHVRAAVALVVADLHHVCGRLGILATSHKPLELEDEVALVVQPLALPDEGATAVEAMAADAVSLLLARIRYLDPGFALDAVSGHLLAEISRRLEGVPLALELVAARISAMGLQEAASAVAGLGAQGDEDEVLRAVFAWTWGLLEPVEQAVLRRASVFVAPFGVPQALAVCAGPGVHVTEVTPALDALVATSLVVRAGGQRRWVLHSAVRELAIERADSAGELAVTRQRHTAWALGRVQNPCPGAADNLGEERADVLQAVARFEVGSEEWLLLQAGLGRDALRHGWVVEAVARAEAVARGTWPDSAAAVEALATAGGLLVDGLNAELADETMARALAMAERVDLSDQQRRWLAYHHGGWLLERDIWQARLRLTAVYDEVLVAGDTAWQAAIGPALVCALMSTGDDTAAVELCERIIEVAVAGGEERMAAVCSLYLGMVLETCDPERADDLYAHAYAVLSAGHDGYFADLAGLWLAVRTPVEYAGAIAREAVASLLRDRVAADPRHLLGAALVAERLGHRDEAAALAGVILGSGPDRQCLLGTTGTQLLEDLAVRLGASAAAGLSVPQLVDTARGALKDLLSRLEGA